MRALIRLAACVLFVLIGVTCTDGPTTPRNAKGGLAMVSIAPRFSVSNQAVYRGLASFGLTVDNVHIHIDHPPAAPFDTVVAYPSGADSLVLALSIVLNGPTEQLNALIELRDGTQVLFSGVEVITATVGATPSTPPPAILLTYVGPGASATRLSIAPRDTAILVGGSAPYRFTATDASGAAVTGASVRWSVSDGTLGAIDAFGTFTPSGKQGRSFITGVTPNGLRDSTTITVTAPPAKLVLVSGGGQSGVAGTPLPQPLIVQAQTSDGTPVPGVPIAFAGTAGGGSAAPASAVTDVNGHAQATMTLGHTAGTQTFAASSPGLTTASANETATAGAAALLVRNSGDAQADTIGKLLAQPLVAKVTDAFGNSVAGATVNWARLAGAGTVAATSSTSDAGGLASVGYTLGTVARTDSISATISGIPASTVVFTERGLPRGASNVTKVSGDAQTATAGSVLSSPLVARVTDNLGNAVPGVLVTWTVPAGGGTVAPQTSTSDSTGTVSVVYTLGGVAGVNQVIGSIGGGVSATFTETGIIGAPANLVKVAGDAQTGSANAALPVRPAVRVTDAHGNPVPNVLVTFSVTAGGGSTTGANQTTDANGVATAGSWTLGAVGAQSLTAAAGALHTVFTASLLTGNAPVKLAIGGSLMPTYASGSALPIVVQVEDANGAPVAQAGIGVAISLEFPMQIAGGGSAAPRRQAAAAVVAVLPTVVPMPTLIGTAIVKTDATGKATFSALSIAGAAGVGFTIAANDTSTAAPLTGDVSAGHSLTAGAPFRLAAWVDSVHQAVGQVVLNVPQARTVDSVGNAAPLSGQLVNFGSITGGGSLSMPIAFTDTAGVVSVPGWTLGTSSGPNTVTASATIGGLRGAMVLTAIAHQPGALRVGVGLPTMISSGLVIAPAPQVQVMDSTLTWALNAWNVSITPQVQLDPSSQTATAPIITQQNNAVTTAPDGSAGFINMIITGAGGSTVSMRFTSPGLTDAVTGQALIQLTAVSLLAPYSPVARR
jgi:hypothetical protein